VEVGVVGAVESLALVTVGESRERFSVGIQACDTAVAVLTENEAALGVEMKPVGAGFTPFKLGGTCVSGGFKEKREAGVG
jgi:hypothetical protein